MFNIPAAHTYAKKSYKNYYQQLLTCTYLHEWGFRPFAVKGLFRREEWVGVEGGGEGDPQAGVDGQ